MKHKHNSYPPLIKKKKNSFAAARVGIKNRQWLHLQDVTNTTQETQRHVTRVSRISYTVRNHSDQNWNRFLIPPSRETAAISSTKCGASDKDRNAPGHDSI